MLAEETEGVCVLAQGCEWGGRGAWPFYGKRRVAEGSKKLGPSTQRNSAFLTAGRAVLTWAPDGWFPKTETRQDHPGTLSLARSLRVTRSRREKEVQVGEAICPSCHVQNEDGAETRTQNSESKSYNNQLSCMILLNPHNHKIREKCNLEVKKQRPGGVNKLPKGKADFK